MEGSLYGICGNASLSVASSPNPSDAASNPPHLILLDMHMPNFDGYETAARLRDSGFIGPIIALTADAMQGDMNRCLEAGCNEYLSKPIDARRLVRLVVELTMRLY